MKKDSLFKITIVLILSMATIFFIYSMVKIDILKSIYVIIISLISIGIDVLFINMLFSPKTSINTKVIITILSVIISVIYILGYIYIDSTRSFIEKITSGNYEYKSYSLVVLNESNYTSIKDLDNTKMGYLNKEDKLNKKLNVEKKNYKNITEALVDLEQNKISSIVLADEYLNVLKEENSKIIDKIRTIYTFKIKTKKDSAKKIDTKKPFVLYISGSDSRVSITEVTRSDVNILLVMNPKTHKILLVSIPRDTYVNLYGANGSKDKLTHASMYGINTSVKTIEEFLNIDINHYLRVSFSTIVDLVDILDGIDIYSDKSFTAYTDKYCKFELGTQHVNGKCALAFSRERKAYQTGDKHRGENQEQVITKIFEKMTNPVYLLKYNEILNKISYSMETSMSYNEITSLIKEELNTLATYQIETYNIDGLASHESTYSMGSQPLYVMIPDENTVDIAREKINNYLNLTNKK